MIWTAWLASQCTFAVALQSLHDIELMSDRFEANLMSHYEEADFRKKLRADRATFHEICHVLAPLLQKQDTRMRKAKTVENRVAIGLWHYAHGGTYENTGEKFGVSAALAHGRKFIDAMLERFRHKVAFPTGDALVQVMKGFETRRNMPNCFGAIDCTHFLISTPCIADYKGYYDRNHVPSTILQAVVDSQGRFIDTYAGNAGAMNDAKVFSCSPLSEFLFQGELTEPVVEMNGINMQPFLVGDPGYKLENFCIIPYLRSELLDPIKERFNFYQSSTRIIVEQAFGRLKGRFRWLNGKITVHNSSEHARIINVGCILHNIMIDSDVQYDKHWAKGVRLRCGTRVRPEKDHSLNSIQLRNALARYVVDRNSS